MTKSKKNRLSQEQNKFFVQPKDRSSLFLCKPIIGITLSNKDEGIDIKSFRLFINNQIVSAIVKENGVYFQPINDLRSGNYKVRLNYIYKSRTQEVQWEFNIVKKVDYKCYLGITHSHTIYSGGKGIPYDAYNMARKSKIKFLIVTEHYKALNKKINKKTLERFKHLKDIKDLNAFDIIHYEKKQFLKKNKKFLSLVGCELSTKFYGHINILNFNRYENLKFKTLEQLYLFIKSKGFICSINHPPKFIGNLYPYKDIDKNICLVEISNGVFHGKYNRYEQTVYSLLDKGWKVGFLNSQDNHKEDWGKSDNFTGILLGKLNNENFYEALLNRRTYSTESRTLSLKFFVNEYPMGSIINVNKNDNIRVKIILKDNKLKIKKIQLISNESKIIYEEDVNNKRYINEICYKAEDVNKWIILKVFLEKNKIAISSPVFY